MGYKTNKSRQKSAGLTSVKATTYEESSVQGIIDALHELINQAVRIDTETRSYAGVISSVDNSVVRLEASAGTLPTIVSICAIEAIIPVTTTVTMELNLGEANIANRGSGNRKNNVQRHESEKVVERDKESNPTDEIETTTDL